MTDHVDATNYSIVAMGPFAPPAYQPNWFAEHQLVGREAAAAATREGGGFALLEDLAKFTLGIIEVTVQRERFQLMTTREDGIRPMMDLFVGTMALTDPVSIKALGFNHAAHFRTGSEKAWHKAGDRLSGKQYWNSVWPKHVGLLNVQLALTRDDDHRGLINVQIQPSGITQFGVFVNVNDHYDFTEAKGTDIASFVADNFLASVGKSNALIDSVIAEALRD
ncbi:hypothetical protein D9M72_477120 [compost metagenome]